jgi:ABC-type antimicrobial peptide transport system permease subunit
MWIDLLILDWGFMCVLAFLVACLFAPLIGAIASSTSLDYPSQAVSIILLLGFYFIALSSLHWLLDYYFIGG